MKTKLNLISAKSHFIIENGDLQVRATNIVNMFALLSPILPQFCSTNPITIFHYSIFDRNDFNRINDKIIFGKIKIYHNSEKSTHNTQTRREATYTTDYIIQQITKYLYEETPLYEQQRQDQTNYICRSLCQRTLNNSPYCQHCCFADTRQANHYGKIGNTTEKKQNKICKVLRPENTYANVKQFFPTVRFPNQRTSATDNYRPSPRPKGSQSTHVSLDDVRLASLSL